MEAHKSEVIELKLWLQTNLVASVLFPLYLLIRCFIKPVRWTFKHSKIKCLRTLATLDRPSLGQVCEVGKAIPQPSSLIEFAETLALLHDCITVAEFQTDGSSLAVSEQIEAVITPFPETFPMSRSLTSIKFSVNQWYLRAVVLSKQSYHLCAVRDKQCWVLCSASGLQYYENWDTAALAICELEAFPILAIYKKKASPLQFVPISSELERAIASIERAKTVNSKCLPSMQLFELLLKRKKQGMPIPLEQTTPELLGNITGMGPSPQSRQSVEPIRPPSPDVLIEEPLETTLPPPSSLKEEANESRSGQRPPPPIVQIGSNELVSDLATGSWSEQTVQRKPRAFNPPPPPLLLPPHLQRNFHAK